MADIYDIMGDLRPGTPEAARELARKKKRFGEGSGDNVNVGGGRGGNTKKPDGFNRELYALLCSEKDGAPLQMSDFVPGQGPGGYKQNKLKLGTKNKVRPWRWVPFTPPGRKDGFQLYHWRRLGEEKKEYAFSKFSKTVDVPAYSEHEYNNHLQAEGWTKLETDHLFDLCRRFDLRFIVIQDRWDRERYPVPRSVEDLKERYYNCVNALIKARTPHGQEPKGLKHFDAEHERRRKEQLIKLYNRTREQVEEELSLLEEMRKIEQRKKEREKKTQDLQKLITAADAQVEVRRAEHEAKLTGRGHPGAGRPGRRRGAGSASKAGGGGAGGSQGSASSNLDPLATTGIKFPEFKAPGVSLRSQRMKLPASLGQRKTKVINELLTELNIEQHPMPTEDICTHFNELRQDIVLLYELKSMLTNCEFELQTLKHQFDALHPGHKMEIPTGLLPTTSVLSSAQVTSTPTTAAPSAAASNAPSTSTSEPSSAPTTAAPSPAAPTPLAESEAERPISERIDVGSLTPTRKRRAAALEQQNLLKKIRKGAIN